ncbi:GNAT family N-acetyltransferase [Labilibaculum sp. K2S]|uniref:GNAT family N-acetyltransferase n=1 Tax=Labilibaculum sp. K2S TaxID=3056386 RepID=UPI0025A3D113|nr:GNAT family N-acetyltransferase [Labilibaculum sp. K2S]MDM8158778.1 GNAT family N-acetyltransferase [Labilibaculum sp. K2S]
MNTNMQILEGKSIRLRALEPTDLKLLYKWENDSTIWEVSHTLKPFSIFILKQYLESSHLDIFETKQLRLVIELIETNTPIGLIDLFDFDPFHQRAGIGILINETENKNKGFASEALQILCNYAFSTLQVHQLYCNITASNEVSLRLFTKQGFEIIGNKKDWIRSKNGWIDEYSLQKINPANP